MRFGSGIAVAAVSASGYSSDSTASLGTSICYMYSPKKTIYIHTYIHIYIYIYMDEINKFLLIAQRAIFCGISYVL